jgi:hypothetical protein
VHYWGVAMRDEVFGEEKAQLLDRCKSVEDAGVGFSLPIQPIDATHSSNFSAGEK